MSSQLVPDYATQPLHSITGKVEKFDGNVSRDGLDLSDAVRFLRNYAHKVQLFEKYLDRLNANPRKHVAVFREYRDGIEDCLLIGTYDAFANESLGFVSNSMISSYDGEKETTRANDNSELILMGVSCFGETKLRIRKHPFFTDGYLILVPETANARTFVKPESD